MFITSTWLFGWLSVLGNAHLNPTCKGVNVAYVSAIPLK